MDAVVDSQIYRFHGFELDLGAHQLRRQGQPVRLERRPLELLVLLVVRHGLLVTREDIVRRLWPGNVVIDFDTGLNTLVRKVRHALGDSPDAPVFIETVAGLGYRFIAPLDMPPAIEPHAPIGPAEQAKSGKRRGIVYAAIVSLLLAAAAALLVTSEPPPAERAPPVSIAVMPFENLTAREDLNYLAAGLAEDTSASLAYADLINIRMIGRASTQAYVRSDRTMAEIGHELGADFVVASSLRAEDSRIRVSSSLVRVSDNVQVWAATFDRELTSVLGLQRELSIAIAEQVRLSLSPEVAAALAKRQTANPEAYDLYLQGRFQWSQLSPASSRRALEFFQLAIAKDPEYALAWAGIAQVLSTAPITGDAEPAMVAAGARDAAQKAVEYGAGLTEAQYALGYFNYFIDWNWPAAEYAFRLAVSLDPNSAIAHMMLGHVLSQSGNHDEARVMMRRARELDPLFSHTFALSSQIAFQTRDYNAALEFARQAVAISPEAWVGYVQLGQALAELGQPLEATAAFDSAERYSGGNSKAIALRAYAQARVGRAQEARAAIAALQARSRERYVPPYAFAIIHAGLDEPDAAFDWLERAYQARDVHLVFLTVDPRWDGLRGDPHFQSLLDRCGFVRKT